MVQQIIVAGGVEIRDAQTWALEQFLDKVAYPQGEYVWIYPNRRRPRFQISLVFTMPEFASALDREGAWVIYDGHSRYGQGPAFGPANTPECPDKKSYPENPWGKHFRMGRDATDTLCFDDLMLHSVTPEEYSLVNAPANAYLPTALERAARRAKAAETAKKRKNCDHAGAWREFDVCHPTLALLKTPRGDAPLAGRHYYAQLGKGDFLTAVKTGRGDLEKSNLKCSVLFMCSCSSHVHYYRPLADRREVTKSKCRFYLTKSYFEAFHSTHFVNALFDGHDPTTAVGAKAICKDVNSYEDSGNVGWY